MKYRLKKNVKGSSSSSISNSSTVVVVVVRGGALLAHQQLRLFVSTSCQLVLEDIGLLHPPNTVVAIWRLNKR